MVSSTGRRESTRRTIGNRFFSGFPISTPLSPALSLSPALFCALCLFLSPIEAQGGAFDAHAGDRPAAESPRAEPNAAADIAEGVDPDIAEGVETVRRFHDDLLDIAGRRETMSFADIKKRMVAAIRRDFDLGFISRYVIGPDWTRMSPEARHHFVDAFTQWSGSVYADRFLNAGFSDYSVTGFERGPGDTLLVKSSLRFAAGASGEERDVDLIYRLRRAQAAETSSSGAASWGPSSWGVVDIIAFGGVSELAARRSEFAQFIRRDGIADLIEHLIAVAARLDNGGGKEKTS